MNKEDIAYRVEQYLNGEIESADIYLEKPENAKEQFFYNTIKRLIRAYKLYSDDMKYKNDFILALRDYMIVFDDNFSWNKDDLLKDNSFGIIFDGIEKKYFATYDLPQGINDFFVRSAFLKDVDDFSQKTEANLITDPYIYRLTGYTQFKSLDQKLGVYGALNTPDGYTTMISLPTGGGKSMVTQTLSYQKEGLTIVVVPTVSLALDQERVTKEIIKRTGNEEEIFSYSSGVAVGPILKAIEDKKARILFISPEALMENSSFVETIKKANKSRYLKNIVIDEAHIVVDWGAGFRVDYQCLEAWRNMLLMSNPALRTFLLSATFEDKCVEILKNFFEIDGKWIEIRCDALRHEPRYCIVRSKSNAEKEKSVIEMIKKLPHPTIIYVARPSEAEHYKKMLADEGIYNVETFTGLTSGPQRRQLINEWVDDKFEIMVATSAFGVGVDKADVRTVIHTYIPQNANTYYQELGRGGRDRLPCLSVMCLHPEDVTIGRDRITKKVLTSEKILGRWDSLYNNEKSKRFSNNRVYIDTSIKPNYADKDEFDDTPTSDADMNWNVYVLLFLRRHNLIDILEVTIKSGHYMILIEIVDDRLRTNDQVLKDYIDEIREVEWAYYSDSYNLICNAVRNNCMDCISELFTGTYSKVYEFCAGCNAHKNPIIGDIPKFPLKSRIEEPLRALNEEQISVFSSTPEALIMSKEYEMAEILRKLIDKGASVVILPDGFSQNDQLLKMSTDNSIMMIGLEEAFQLIKRKAFFYLSGLVVVIYPSEEKEIGEQYTVIRNNLCDRSSTKVIHIIEKDAYVAEAGKYITELVDGPMLQAKVVFA